MEFVFVLRSAFFLLAFLRRFGRPFRGPSVYYRRYCLTLCMYVNKFITCEHKQINRCKSIHEVHKIAESHRWVYLILEECARDTSASSGKLFYKMKNLASIIITEYVICIQLKNDYRKKLHKSKCE